MLVLSLFLASIFIKSQLKIYQGQWKELLVQKEMLKKSTHSQSQLVQSYIDYAKKNELFIENQAKDSRQIFYLSIKQAR